MNNSEFKIKSSPSSRKGRNDFANWELSRLKDYM